MLSLSPKVIFITVLSASICLPSWASREDAELNRLLLELEALERIVRLAEHSADKESSISFNYQQLRKDLELIQQGIRDNVNSIQRDPRYLPEIEGNF